MKLTASISFLVKWPDFTLGLYLVKEALLVLLTGQSKRRISDKN